MVAAVEEARLLADQLLVPRRPPLTFVTYEPKDADALAVLHDMRETSLSDLLLPNGASMSMEGAGDGTGYYGLVRTEAWDENLVGVQVRAWGWDYKYYSQYPNAPTYTRKIDLTFLYSVDKWMPTAGVVVSVSVSGNREGSQRYMPDVMRDLWADEYFEMGYEGHGQVHRRAKAHEVRYLVDVIRDLYILAGKPR